MPGERTRLPLEQIELISSDGKSSYVIQVKNDSVVPSAAEIAAVGLNHIWLKNDAVAGDFLGWVKTDATTVKEFGAISV